MKTQIIFNIIITFFLSFYSLFSFSQPLSCNTGLKVVWPTGSGSVINSSVTATGGSTPYVYQWSSGQTTQTVSGLSPGTYSVMVTDAFGHTCTSWATVNAEMVNVPHLLDTVNFKLEPFVDFETVFSGHPKAFYMQLSEGVNGFPRGLFVSSGPAVGSLSTENDRLFFVDSSANASVFINGFHSGNEAFVFAKSPHGTGMLITAPQSNQILRADNYGNISVFASSVGTSPFGPAGITYRGDSLYVSDFLGASTLKISPFGTPNPIVNLSSYIEHEKDLTSCTANFGGDFLVGNFSIDTIHTYHGKILKVTGGTVTQIADSLDGLVERS